MPAIGTNQHNKVQCLVNCEIVLRDIKIVLNKLKEEILDVDAHVTLRVLKKMPHKLDIALNGVEQVEHHVQDALRCDGKFRLAQDLKSNKLPLDKKQQTIKDWVCGVPINKKGHHLQRSFSSVSCHLIPHQRKMITLIRQ